MYSGDLFATRLAAGLILNGAFAAPGDSSAIGSPGAIAAAIPEPSACAALLGMLALAGTAWFRRRVVPAA